MWILSYLFVIYFSYSFCKYYRYAILLYNTTRQSSHKIFFLNEQTAFHAKLYKEKRVQLNWVNLMIPYIRRWQKPYTHLAKAHLGKSIFIPYGSKHVD
jgi:hypothetical protein